VRLKLDNMDPKCYSATCWCNVRFGLCDHLCNPLYLLLMAMTVISTTLCKSQQWFWDCDGLHNGHFEFVINSGVLQGATGFEWEPPPSLEPRAAGRPFSQAESARGAGDATSGHNKSAEVLREEVIVLISVPKATTFSSLVGPEQRQQ
jgi:hypothetical protein